MDSVTPSEKATIIIRLIRSFEFRNIRNVVLRDIELATVSTEELKTKVVEALPTYPGLPPPFRKYDYDTLKIEHHAHGAKTNDPVINCEDDEMLILKDEETLANQKVRNETEISFFKLADYLNYKKSPNRQWETTNR